MTHPAIAMSATGIEKSFERPRIKRVLSRQDKAPKAVAGVSLDVRKAEIFGLIGESGSGKSVLARCIAGILQPDAGVIQFPEAMAQPHGQQLSRARVVQMVFQDPYSSLNPRMSIGEALIEILKVNGIADRASRQGKAGELLDLVGLPSRILTVRPRQLSGGQRQRVAIARALAIEPRLLVADEPTSALDVSVQASILNLILDLREQLSLSILMITHNMAVVRQVCDRVAVMHVGRLVETGAASEVLDHPRDTYTQALIDAVPKGHGKRWTELST